MRLRQLNEEFGGRFTLTPRAFVLRPERQTDARFTAYHLQHRERARELTGLPYQLPPVGAPYPSSSLPALIAAKWVRQKHPNKFDEFDLALFAAFFERSEDISDFNVLAKIAQEFTLPAVELQQALNDQSLTEQVLKEFLGARHLGISAVPSVVIGNEVIAGAVGIEEYRRAAKRAIGG